MNCQMWGALCITFYSLVAFVFCIIVYTKHSLSDPAIQQCLNFSQPNVKFFSHCRIIEWKANIVFALFIWDVKIITSKNAHTMNFYEFQTKWTKTDGATENGILWEEWGKGTELAVVQQVGIGHYNTDSKCSWSTSYVYALSILTDKWKLKIF